jgi:hypothetical protein
MQVIEREVTIAASPAQVWDVLTDFRAYPEWNPFLERVEGVATQGTRVTIRFHPPGARPTTLRPLLLLVEPPRELRWRGRVLLPGLLDAVHSLRIEPAGPERVRFVQHEEFSGILLPLFRGTVRKGADGFDAMNQALKQRVERLAGVG